MLGTLKSLEVLELRTQVELSPSGFRELLNLSNLQELTLSDRLANDNSMEDLSKLPAVKVLTVRSVFVTDQGIGFLKRLTHLQTLRILLSSQITEVGIRHLAELSLKELDLTYSDASDEKLKSLRKLSGLKNLRLTNAIRVTDESVSYFTELRDLKTLDLADAKLTKAGISQLEKSLPQCKVNYDAIPRN